MDGKILAVKVLAGVSCHIQDKAASLEVREKK
jgi:hypothetical protein